MTRQETLTGGYQFFLSEEASVPSAPNEGIEERRSEIKILRTSGVKNSRIAHQLGISMPTLYRNIAELVSAGEIPSRVKPSASERKPPPRETPRTRELDEQVLRLRNDPRNLTNQQIAQELSYSPSTISRSIRRLIKEGLQQPRRKGKQEIHETKLPPKETVVQKRKELDNRVLELRNDPRNLTNQQIAQELSCSISQIARSIHRLIEVGKLKKRERIAGNIAVSEKVRMREEKIVRLRSQKPMLTNEQIAEKLDISLTPLGRSVKRLTQAGKIIRRSSRPKTEQEIEFGIETTEDRDNYVERMRKQGATNSEIAAKLGRPMGTIHRSVRRLIEAGRITQRTRGKLR